MQDIKISNYKINEREELSFKVLIKPWDFTIAEKELIKNATKQWDYLDLTITWLISWDTEKLRKEKLVKLNWLMSVYCEKNILDIDCEKNRLYEKYNIKSRKELSDSDLDSEIESYKAWLMEF